MVLGHETAVKAERLGLDMKLDHIMVTARAFRRRNPAPRRRPAEQSKPHDLPCHCASLADPLASRHGIMTTRLIDGMRELAPHYDGVILDLWGVVHDGTAPFPGGLDCMQRLIDAEKRLVLLSNAPRRSDDVVRRIAKIGVPDHLFHGVMSSGEEAWLHLHHRNDPFYAALGRRCLHIGSDRDLEIRGGLRPLFFLAHPEAACSLQTPPAAGGVQQVIDNPPSYQYPPPDSPLFLPHT